MPSKARKLTPFPPRYEQLIDAAAGAFLITVGSTDAHAIEAAKSLLSEHLTEAMQLRDGIVDGRFKTLELRAVFEAITERALARLSADLTPRISEKISPEMAATVDAELARIFRAGLAAIESTLPIVH